jgi:preprotein translocase subunit SecG
MIGLVIAIHVFVCLVLIIIILIQRGRGGGFIESFAGLESMFGTKTSAFLSRLTSIMAVIFFFTCLGLAFLSLRESKSLMYNVKQKVIFAPQAVNVNTTSSGGKISPEEARQPVAAENIPATAPVNQTAK